VLLGSGGRVLELRQTRIPPRLGHRIRPWLLRLTLVWLLPGVCVVAFAYAVTRRS